MVSGRRALVLWTALVAGVGSSGGCADEDGSKPQGLTVMTLNAYYGFDAAPLLSAGDPAEIPILAAQAFEQLVATRFDERAQAMADEIGRRLPHVIALQEVALFRIQSPGDLVEGGTTPADTVLFDHLGILMAALADRGLDYRVAGQVKNVDIELPMITGIEPPYFDDVRLTDFDVLLVRGDVPFSDVHVSNYQSRLAVLALGAEIPRGFVSAMVSVTGIGDIRVVTTHLEDLPFEDIQRAQVEELIAALASESDPVLLMGDFNSPAPDGATCEVLRANGFMDVAGEGDDGGLTWGHDPGLSEADPAFSMRIDFILVRQSRIPALALGKVKKLHPASIDLWGDDPEERTASGLWPSDHAAVIAEFHFGFASSR